MNYALLVLLALVLVSCSAYKQVPYLQASEYLDTSGQNPPLYDARIMPKDLLTHNSQYYGSGNSSTIQPDRSHYPQ